MNLSLTITAGYDCELNPQAVCTAAGLERVGDLRDRHIREFHELGNLLVRALPGSTEAEFAAEILRDSLSKKERLWLVIADEEQAETLREWLPEGVRLLPLGKKQKWRDSYIVPLGLIPTQFAAALNQSANSAHRWLVTQACRGIDGMRLPYSLQTDLIRRGVHVRARSKIVRLLANPKFLAYLVVLVYSGLRALPVTFVRQFHGSLLVLWTIDLTTAIPYTWGILAMVTAARLRVRFVGLIVAIVTFVLPYVYFAINGSDYPPIVIAVIAILIISTLMLEVAKWWLDRRVSRCLADAQLR